MHLSKLCTWYLFFGILIGILLEACRIYTDNMIFAFPLKLYTFLSIFLFLPFFIRNLTTKKIIYLFLVSAWITLNTILRVFLTPEGITTLSSIFSQSIGIILVMVLFLARDKKTSFDIYNFFYKYKYVITLPIAALVVTYEILAFYKHRFPGLDLSLLAPIHSLSMINNQLSFTIIIFLLFFISLKRAPFIAAFISLILIRFALLIKKRSFNKKSLPLFFIGLLSLIFIVFIFFEEAPLLYKNRVIAPFKLMRLSYEPNENASKIDTSFAEKLVEVKQSSLLYIHGWRAYLLGNGIGWEFNIRPGILRHYTHITPYYLFLLFGVWGVAFYIFLLFKCLILLFSPNSITRFYALMTLFFLLIGLAELYLFTTPIFIYSIGEVLAIKISKKSRLKNSDYLPNASSMRIKSCAE